MRTAQWPSRWLQQWRLYGPGFTLSAVVALAAMFLARHYDAPLMLFALLLGMALNFLSKDQRSAAGIDVVARQVLRMGVALLGLRLTVDQVGSLGWQPVVAVCLAVCLTILFGSLLARLMGFKLFFGLLTAGAVAICGASAALALSATLPAHPLKERATLFTVIGVSTLSTLAMVSYPLLAQWLGLDSLAAGFFIGATIHDVAQVVGAGYSISNEAGDLATVVKLLRVSLLLPVILLTAWLVQRYPLIEPTTRKAVPADSRRPPLLPWFAIAFAVLVGLNSTGLLPAQAVAIGVDVSHVCLVAAMAAIGMKTQLRDIFSVGWRPIVLMVAETAFLAVLVIQLLPLLPVLG